ncbi:RICIN domain-containing protein [Amycolatopsis coloradensis]|uniref:RICIN domain-containing protein n=1 Tax=Amycolatopsis coloradensis TaxID=76021 RepID=UPI00130198D1|nr:RICIN domain-containing protein [Amycolatopsis coloradensis]
MAIVAMILPLAIAGATPAEPRTGREATSPALEAAQQRARQLNAPVRYISDGTTHYAGLVEQAGNTCLDLAEGTGPAILHFRCHGLDNQVWVLQGARDYWEIKPLKDTSKCADVERSTGPNVISFTCRQTDNQLWEWWTDERNVSWFSPASNRLTCLDAEGDHGTRALAWRCHNGGNQHWQLI